MIIIERPASALVRFILFDKDIDTDALMVADIVETSLATNRKTQNIVMDALAKKALHLWSIDKDPEMMKIGFSRDSLVAAKQTPDALVLQMRTLFEGPH